MLHPTPGTHLLWHEGLKCRRQPSATSARSFFPFLSARSPWIAQLRRTFSSTSHADSARSSFLGIIRSSCLGVHARQFLEPILQLAACRLMSMRKNDLFNGGRCCGDCRRSHAAGCGKHLQHHGAVSTTITQEVVAKADEVVQACLQENIPECIASEIVEEFVPSTPKTRSLCNHAQRSRSSTLPSRRLA